MATFNVTTQSDREFLEEHEILAQRLAQLEATRAAREAQAAEAQAKRDVLGIRARRGLVRYKGALDGLLEATLDDIAYERDNETNEIIKVYTNADAKAARSR